jgi:hypothetical protein
MAKKMIALRPGSLMEVTATKGITSILSLQEKTRTDRKTLQSINEGICVKESTLQKIATRLHIPLDHLAPPPVPRIPTAQKEAATNHARELVLKPLNAKQLFELLREISLQDNLSWTLKLDQASSEVLKLLLQFETEVREWLRLLNDREREEENQKSLKGQLGKIQTRGDIENLIQAIAEANIKIFGANYVQWSTEDHHQFLDEFPHTVEYLSSVHCHISIEPRNTTSSTVSIDEGDKPSRWFPDNQPRYLQHIMVDGEIVWSRPPRAKGIFDDNGIPFWEDEQS